MKMYYSSIAAIVLAALMVSCNSTSEEPAVMKTQSDSASYLFGFQLGGQFAKTKIELNTDMLMAGFNDAKADKKAQISDSGAMALSE
ncbi:MAG: FKBP-type peptidyl-prolyl cis-trans isomerase N-terminal domain-containing protein, partial [Ignavibacteria bacterium]